MSLDRIVEKQDGHDEEKRKRGVKLEFIVPSPARLRRLPMNSGQFIKKRDTEDGNTRDQPDPKAAKHQGDNKRHR